MKVNAYGASSKRFRKIRPIRARHYSHICIAINKRHPRRPSAPAPRTSPRQGQAQPFTQRCRQSNIETPVCGRDNAGSSQHKKLAQTIRDGAPNRFERPTQRRSKPCHCGIVAKALGCGCITPAPTSKPDDGNPNVPFVKRKETRASEASSQGMHGDVRRGHPLHVRCDPPFKVQSESRYIRNMPHRFVERPGLQRH